MFEDEQAKQRAMIALIAFNATVMVYGVYRLLTRVEPWGFGAAALAALIAIVLGLVVGGLVYLVAIWRS